MATVNKKDFKPLLKALRLKRNKAKQSTKALYHKKHGGYYPIEFRVQQEVNDATIMLCNRVIEEIEQILNQ